MARTKQQPRSGSVSAPLPGLRIFSPAVYFVGLLFVAMPLAEMMLNLWPMSPGDLGWRYGAVGLFAQFLHTPLLGALILTVFAAVAGHPRVLRACGWAWLSFTVVLVLATATFALDALQMRPTVLPESRLVYHTSVVRAILKHTTGGIAFALLGMAALRARRGMVGGHARESQTTAAHG